MDTKALRQKVLDLAIRGKLVPQDPNDEPASALLERIRAQKQQMVKEGKLKAKDIKNDTVIFVGEDNLHYEKFQDGTVKCIEDEIPFDLPAGWVWCRLGSVFSTVTGSTPSTKDSSLYGNDYPFYKPTDLDAGFEVYRAEDSVSEKGYLSGRSLPERSVLVTCIGATIGKTGYIRNTGICNQQINAILPQEDILSEYTYFCMCSQFEQQQIWTNSSATTLPILNKSRFDNLLLPIPPKKQQLLVVARIEELLHFVEIIKKEKITLQEIIKNTKPKILDLAIRGQLVPQDPNDEPASVLLERIRAEKEELIKQGKIKRDKIESVIFRGEDNSYYQRVESDGVVTIKQVNIPSTWAACSLRDISYNVSSVGMQIKSEDIEEDGLYPVISQGQMFIDGYSDDESKVIFDYPIVLFGDHTRNVKYIDFPFVVGADGTKLHKVICINETYAYYWMCYAAQHIADKGYARHYSLLQKECFTLPPLAEQKRIVSAVEQMFTELDAISNYLS